jgi:hypothetical protein
MVLARFGCLSLAKDSISPAGMLNVVGARKVQLSTIKPGLLRKKQDLLSKSSLNIVFPAVVWP